MIEVISHTATATGTDAKGDVSSPSAPSTQVVLRGLCDRGLGSDHDFHTWPDRPGPAQAPHRAGHNCAGHTCARCTTHHTRARHTRPHTRLPVSRQDPRRLAGHTWSGTQ